MPYTNFKEKEQYEQHTIPNEKVSQSESMISYKNTILDCFSPLQVEEMLNIKEKNDPKHFEKNMLSSDTFELDIKPICLKNTLELEFHKRFFCETKVKPFFYQK